MTSPKFDVSRSARKNARGKLCLTVKVSQTMALPAEADLIAEFEKTQRQFARKHTDCGARAACLLSTVFGDTAHGSISTTRVV